MSLLGKTLVVKGELHASENLTIAGRVDGSIRCQNFEVVFAPTAQMTGDIIARDITVFGRVNGQLVATDVIDIRPDANVTGRIISRRFILNEGAYVNARAEPQHLDAALRVAKFQEQKKDVTASSSATPR